MFLKDYIPNIKKEYSKFFFSGIAFDSSKVKRNDIFFAIEGNNFDGNKFIPIVIKKGVELLSLKKKSIKNINQFWLFTQKMSENCWQRFHLKFLKINQKI